MSDCWCCMGGIYARVPFLHTRICNVSYSYCYTGECLQLSYSYWREYIHMSHSCCYMVEYVPRVAVPLQATNYAFFDFVLLVHFCSHVGCLLRHCCHLSSHPHPCCCLNSSRTLLPWKKFGLLSHGKMAAPEMCYQVTDCCVFLAWFLSIDLGFCLFVCVCVCVFFFFPIKVVQSNLPSLGGGGWGIRTDIFKIRLFSMWCERHVVDF